jgi:hypothetical protein
MALTTGEFTPTALTAYISESWTPEVLEEYFADAVAANFFMDLSPYAGGGSDIFHIPNVFTTAFSVSTQPDPYDAAEITTDAPATGDITLTIDTHKYIATIIGDRDLVQIAKIYNLNEIYNRKAMGTLVETLDAALYALQSSVSTNSVGDTASVITDSEIRQAIEKLASADVPTTECAFHFHPYSYFIQVIAIQKYYDAAQFGANASVTKSGTLGDARGLQRAFKGQLFGIDILMSSQVVNTLLAVKNLLAHKDAFAYATQLPTGGRVRFQAAYLLDRLGTLAVWDSHYGVVASREAAATLIQGSNAFIAS